MCGAEFENLSVVVAGKAQSSEGWKNKGVNKRQNIYIYICIYTYL